MTRFGSQVGWFRLLRLNAVPDVLKLVDEGMAGFGVDVIEGSVDFLAIFGFDFGNQCEPLFGEHDVVDASVVGDVLSRDKDFRLEFVKDGGDAGAGDDEPFAEFGLGDVAFGEFQRKEHVELSFGEVVLTEESGRACGEQIRGAHNAEDGFVSHVFEGQL